MHASLLRRKSAQARSLQRGATLVEAAVVSLILFTILLAIIDFARAYSMYQVMTDAAREGARLGVAPQQGLDATSLPSETAIKAVVNQYLAANGISGATVTVQCQVCSSKLTQVINGATLNYTNVQVSKPFTFQTALRLVGPVNIQTQATMRNETN